MSARTKTNPLIVALDVEPDRAESTIQELKDYVDTFKIGNRLFTALGPDVVRWVQDSGCSVFLDLKFHDIPLTVSESCRNAVRMKVWGLTIHVSGGFAMMKEAGDAARQESQALGVARPLLFGVTVLTSLSDPDLRQIGSARSVSSQVRRLSALAKKSGLDGVVASGNEIGMIRKTCGKDFLIVVPGIRSGENLSKEDQKRVMTARRAVGLGADYLVVGRPILEARDRVAETQKILSEVS